MKRTHDIDLTRMAGTTIPLHARTRRERRRQNQLRTLVAVVAIIAVLATCTAFLWFVPMISAI